ncbi:putative Tigger transposable element-derived protein 1-like 259 [Homarus americanus]|uniref:Putative Tigger transposable element-derived protein 1-like 259 n=1 Tax=Homarus americanus TaxID=6706 RepID=A0A8J5JSD4_HOMAM|nr:putative Tigger transposable element-derived protein 1-like 259 [Homarus americanus]
MEGHTELLEQCVWWKVWPESVNNFSGFADVVPVHSNISKKAGFQEVDEGNVAEVLKSHSEDLLFLEQQKAVEE